MNADKEILTLKIFGRITAVDPRGGVRKSQSFSVWYITMYHFGHFLITNIHRNNKQVYKAGYYLNRLYNPVSEFKCRHCCTSHK